MADLIDPSDIDVALRVLLDQPSYGAQVLIVTARMLELDATEPATWTARRRAWEIATDAVLGRLPEVVRCDSVQRAQRALPDLTGDITRGEAALRLRAAARELG